MVLVPDLYGHTQRLATVTCQTSTNWKLIIRAILPTQKEYERLLIERNLF